MCILRQPRLPGNGVRIWHSMDPDPIFCSLCACHLPPALQSSWNASLLSLWNTCFILWGGSCVGLLKVRECLFFYSGARLCCPSLSALIWKRLVQNKRIQGEREEEIDLGYDPGVLLQSTSPSLGLASCLSDLCETPPFLSPSHSSHCSPSLQLTWSLLAMGCQHCSGNSQIATGSVLDILPYDMTIYSSRISVLLWLPLDGIGLLGYSFEISFLNVATRGWNGTTMELVIKELYLSVVKLYP